MMEDFKTKFLDLINKQNRQLKIPAMGFSEYFIQNVSDTPEPFVKKSHHHQTSDNDDDSVDNSNLEALKNKLSDQEILESIEEIYFKEDCDINSYILNKVYESDELSQDQIQKSMVTLKQQQKVISKKVLHHILEQRSSCNEEFQKIGIAERDLEQALWTCRKARSYLSYAKKQLTTTSLEILANYRKREILRELLKSLNAIKVLKSADTEMQKLLVDGNYSGAISLLLECKATASEFTEYICIQSLSQKLQETLILTEYQIDTVLNEMTTNFDVKKYSQLQEAYKLLNKSMFAMDQLHINFISAIHSTVNNVLRSFNDPISDETKQKQLFEHLCENVPAEKYITCLIALCKSFWTILTSYYQIVMWHQNYKLFPVKLDMKTENTEGDDNASSSTTTTTTANTAAIDDYEFNQAQDLYIEEKLKKGQSRIWNDIQSKLCTYLSSPKLKLLKYEQFIQILSIIQRLKKVGSEFCGENSSKLIETMRLQSVEFFNRYHISCLEEICLFLDNESWVPVDSFTNILQLQEFRSVKHSLQRQKSPPLELKCATIIPNVANENHNQKNNNSQNNSKSSSNNGGQNLTTANNMSDELVSMHSQDGGSSIYGSCGYFVRFSEKSSPFDGGLDVTMFEEDVLSGIIDEASCYFSEDSDVNAVDDDGCESKSAYNDESIYNQIPILANNTSLNVLRCIGKYLQMCKLLHCISPQIVTSMLELIAFYIYAVHDIFGKDAAVPMENLYDEKLERKLEHVHEKIVSKIKGWPLNFSSLKNNELCNPDTLFGLSQRIVAIESGICMMKQFEQLKNYFLHLIPQPDREILRNIQEYHNFAVEISKPIYTCVASKSIDIQGILMAMSKVKWDVNHVSVQHSSYIDTLNRSVQSFAMRLEEISKEIQIPYEIIWNCLAHVSTHLLVEGFSNAKKCSAGGRALMQLDFTHFMSILELISGFKFITHRTYVDSYVKAYYFPSELFEEWINTQKDKNDYSIKQLTNLVTCVCSNDKRTRQKLLAIIDSGSLTGGNNLNQSTSSSN